MASNSFGNLFRITTWGESHGKAIGVVIDGCPAGLEISAEEINVELAKRSPGNSIYTTPRKESDLAEIYSGVFDGMTTGAPISIIIFNTDVDSSKYEPIKHLLRPGHANFTYLEKYGIFDYRGGGRSSGRETACRVAAGAIAKKFLKTLGIIPVAYLHSMGDIAVKLPNIDPVTLQQQTLDSPLFCPDQEASDRMMKAIEQIKEEKDSLGGVVELVVSSLPVGLGDPMYSKLEANLASAMLSIPASKGFEIGSGFSSAKMRGSQHNDAFVAKEGKVETASNNAGGTLGGISTGMPLIVRVAFKPTSSIEQEQKSVNLNGCEEQFRLPSGSRHDPCIAIRAVPVVEAMAAIVIMDAILQNRSVTI